MFYVFLLGGPAAGAVIYLYNAGLFPGLKEERFGVLDPLPPNLGQWHTDADSDAGDDANAHGKKSEVRFWIADGGLFTDAPSWTPH